MTTTYATLEDPLNPSGAVQFDMDGNFTYNIHEVGSLVYPLGNSFPTKRTSGSKGLGGILIVTATSDAQNALVKTLMQTVTPLTLTLPNGISETIAWDPQTDRKCTSQFSLMLWLPVWQWTANFYQAA